MARVEVPPARALAELASLIEEQGKPGDDPGTAVEKIVRHISAWRMCRRIRLSGVALREGADVEGEYDHLTWAVYRMLFLLDSQLLEKPDTSNQLPLPSI